jgi:DNA-binding CsgD family transcriptional regulator
MGREVIGREAELATILQFVDARPARPGLLMIEGEPGIGKTTLWLEAVRRGRETGWRTLTAQPTEPESTLSFAALGDLFDPVYDEAAAALSAPQRHAIEVALLRTESTNGAPDLRAVAVATLTVLRSVWMTGPVLPGRGRRPMAGQTAAERQVAEFAAEGKTNKEIAEIAFTSVKTVEGHLSRTYSKLGLRSRTELARTLSPRPSAVTPRDTRGRTLG